MGNCATLYMVLGQALGMKGNILATGASPLGIHNSILTRATACRSIHEAVSIGRLHEKWTAKKRKPEKESDIRGFC